MAAKKKKAVKRTPVNSGVAAKAAPQRTSVASTNGAKAGLLDMTRNQRLAAAKAVAKKINDDFKSEVVIMADQAHSNSYVRRPCGLMQLDIDTGGGLPAGTFNTISGPDGSGKTTLLYCYFAQHQRLYGEDSFCALSSSEGQIDYFQARRMGWIIPVPVEVIEARQKNLKLLGAPLLTDEEVAELRRGVGINTITDNLSTAEEILDVTERLLHSNLYGIIGLDSYEGLMPKAEAALDSLEDFAQQAARASAITRFLQHYGPITRNRQHFTTFIMTCQVRSNRKKSEAQTHMQKYIKDWATTVPYAIRHWRQIDLTVWSGEKLYRKERKDESPREVLGKYMNWEISKGKLNTHDNIRGEAPYWYDERGFEPLRSVVVTGLRYGIIEERDGLLTFLRNGEPDEYLRNISGPDTFVQAMAEEPESEWDLRRTILAAAGKSCLYV